MKFQSYSLALAAAFAFATPIAASAAASADTQTVGVHYKDLDLASEAGKAELERRLDSAARNVCGMGERRTGTRIASNEARTCYREARGQMDRHLAVVIERQTAAGG